MENGMEIFTTAEMEKRAEKLWKTLKKKEEKRMSLINA